MSRNSSCGVLPEAVVKLRLWTGELTDSLALDSLTDYNRSLILSSLHKPFILELKTKTDQIRHLPDIPKSNIVLSWSLNPPDTVRVEELKSAPLEKRLEAAALAVKKGYRLLFDCTKPIDWPRTDDWFGERFPPLAYPDDETMKHIRENWDSYGINA